MIGSQFAILALSRALGSVAQAACMIFLARWTDPVTFGYMSIVIGLGMVMVAVSDLGLGTYVLRARVVPDLRESVRGALRLNMLSSLVLVAVGIGALILFAQLESIFFLMIPAAIWLAAEKNADIWLNISVADNRAAHAAVAIIVRRGSAVVVFFGLHFAGVEPVFAFTLSFAIGSVVGLLASRQLVRIGYSDRVGYRALLTRSWPYWVSNLTSQIRNLDVLLVALFAGSTSSGLYASAVRLTNPILLVTGSLTSVLLPNVSRSDAHTVRKYHRRLIFAIACLVALTLALGYPFSVVGVWLLGPAYADAQPAIFSMLVSMMFVGFSPALASFLQGLSDSRYAASNGLVFVPVIIAGVSAGAFVGGALGAAIAIGIVFFLKCLVLEHRILTVLSRLSKRSEDSVDDMAVARRSQGVAKQ